MLVYGTEQGSKMNGWNREIGLLVEMVTEQQIELAVGLREVVEVA